MKINTLQILRAVAAISVVVTHVFQNLNYKPFGNYYLSGQYGVDIFFILSGFLIYLTTKKGTAPLIFAKKRLFRIYPLYIFAFVIYALTGVGKYSIDYSVKSFLQNILMIPWDKGLGYDSLIVGVAWSTVFEMFFYFLFFIIIILNISRKKVLIILPSLFIVSQLIIRFVLTEGIEIPFLSLFLSLGASYNLFMFFMGCLICELFIRNKFPLINKKFYTSLFVLVCILAFIMLLLKWNPLMSYVVCSLLFIMVIQFERFYKLKFNSKVVKLLIHWGDISFSIYIFHMLFIKVYVDYLGVTDVTFLLIITLISTILFSNLTYKWIEKPFMDYSKGKGGLYHHYKLLLNTKIL